MVNVIRAAMIETMNVAEIPDDTSPLDDEDISRIRDANIAHVVKLIRLAFSEGAEIICLNELAPAPYFAIGEETQERWIGFAESAEEGPTIRAIQELTRELTITVLVPIYEQTEAGDRYNTTVVIEDGEILGKYRKTHIPHGSNEQGNFTEGFYYKASDDTGQNKGKKRVSGHPLFPVFETRVGNVGVATCFDRHFQYVWQHYENAGAQLVFSPAVTFGATSQEAWKHEFPAEAVRHGFYVGGSNKRGQEFPPDGPTFFGNSYFVGPDGRRLDDLSAKPELIISDLDLDQVAANPSGWNLPGNQRNDLAQAAIGITYLPPSQREIE
jgi:beta-ureidopropionase